MLHPDWNLLASTLSCLEITFPSFYSAGTSSIQSKELIALLKSAPNLTHFKMRGLEILHELIPIFEFVKNGPKLQSLVLDKCHVCFTDALGNPNLEPNFSLKKVHLLNGLNYWSLIEYLLVLAPNLEELVLRPQKDLDMLIKGLELSQISQLSKFSKLQKLEVQVATEDCINNMPEFVYVLREFPALRYLVLSWGAYPPEVNYTSYYRMVEWLNSALRADNADILVQISYPKHSNIYTNPPSLTG